MENITVPSCQFNKEHKLCTKPVQLPCQADGTTTAFACLNCIKQRTAHTGLFSCPNCNTEHNFNFKLNTIENNNQVTNKDFSVSKDLANQLLNLMNKSKYNIQGNSFLKPPFVFYYLILKPLK